MAVKQMMKLKFKVTGRTAVRLTYDDTVKKIEIL